MHISHRKSEPNRISCIHQHISLSRILELDNATSARQQW